MPHVRAWLQVWQTVQEGIHVRDCQQAPLLFALHQLDLLRLCKMKEGLRKLEVPGECVSEGLAPGAWGNRGGGAVSEPHTHIADLAPEVTKANGLLHPPFVT